MRRPVVLATLLATTSLASSVYAKDLPVRAPSVMPVPFLVSDWSGIYVGAEGGYGWDKESLDTISPGDAADGTGRDFFPDGSVGSVKQRGGLFGGFFGMQKQWGSWVLGLEADVDGARINGSGASSATTTASFDVEGCGNFPCNFSHSYSVSSKIDMLGSIRGKVGFVPGPDWMIYGTGGLAFAHVQHTVTDYETATDIDGDALPGGRSFTGSGGDSILGWAAGAGFDWKFRNDADSAWILGVEYLHYGFGTHTFVVSQNLTGSVAISGSESADVIKGRISFLFASH